MKHLAPAFRTLIFFTIFTGVIYPLLMTFISSILFSQLSGGDLVMRNSTVIGARAIAQKFTSPKYFWGRPSSIDYNPLPSGGSNLGPTSAALKKTVNERAATVRQAHGLGGSADIPNDLIFASGSGLDPDIHPDTALFQIDRVVKARGLRPEQANMMSQWIHDHTQKPDLGFIGEPRVNVLELNLALDEIAGRPQ